MLFFPTTKNGILHTKAFQSNIRSKTLAQGKGALMASMEIMIKKKGEKKKKNPTEQGIQLSPEEAENSEREHLTLLCYAQAVVT